MKQNLSLIKLSFNAPSFDLILSFLSFHILFYHSNTQMWILYTIAFIQCAVNQPRDARSNDHTVTESKYQLMDEAVQPEAPKPIAHIENERWVCHNIVLMCVAGFKIC